MHRFAALAAVAVFSFASVASAADLPVKAPAYMPPPPPPAYNWTGFYVGGNAGYAWGHSHATSVSDCGAGFTGWYCWTGDGLPPMANAAAVAADGSGSLHPRGFIGGVQAGYNWQRGSFVYGAEIDFEALDLSASRSAGRVYPFDMAGRSYVVGSSVDTDWLFTARGRLGWAWGDALIYFTGGVAVTNLKTSNNFVDNEVQFGPGVGASSSSRTKAGWVLGGGVEWAMSRNWSLRAEYLRVDFGSVDTTAVVWNATHTWHNTINTSTDLAADIVRAGINYHFN